MLLWVFSLVALIAVLFTITQRHRSKDPVFFENQVTPRHANKIRFALVPYESGVALRKKFTPFAEYLSEELGQQVEIVICSDYVAAIEALRWGHAELVEFGIMPFLIAKREAEAIPLFSPVIKGEKTYRSVIIARKDSQFQGLQQLRGRAFAFVDPASTSGYLFPMDMLVKAGLSPSNDLRSMFSGSHQGVVQAVLRGQVDAGGTFDAACELYLKDPAEREKLIVIASSPEIPYGVLVVGKSTSREFQTKVRQAILKLNNLPENGVYKEMGIDRYDYASGKLFDEISKLAQELGIRLK